MYSELSTLLSTAITISTFLISTFIVIKIIRNQSESLWLKMVNSALLFTYLTWYILYAISSKLELDAMNRVFTEGLPGTQVSYVFIAILFSLCFALLIITYRNLFLSFLIIFALGFSDLFGNLEIMTAMQYIANNRISGGHELVTAELIWLDFFFSNNHLTRIATYMALVFIGFLFYALSKLKYIDLKNNEILDLSNEMTTAIQFCQRHWLWLEIIGKVLFIIALTNNELTVWDWRFDREHALVDASEHSTYFQWRPMDAFSPGTED